MKRIKRGLSLLLVLCLCVSMMPIRAGAQESTTMTESLNSIEEFISVEQPLIIQTVKLDEDESDRAQPLNNNATDYRKWCQTDTRWGSLPLGS